MQRTVEELTRAIADGTALLNAYDKFVDELPVNMTCSDFRTIAALTLVNLRRQRVLAISGEEAAADIAQAEYNDRFDVAEERAEENKDKLRQQRERAERRIEEREWFRGAGNR